MLTEFRSATSATSRAWSRPVTHIRRAVAKEFCRRIRPVLQSVRIWQNGTTSINLCEAVKAKARRTASQSIARGWQPRNFCSYDMSKRLRCRLPCKKMSKPLTFMSPTHRSQSYQSGLSSSVQPRLSLRGTAFFPFDPYRLQHSSMFLCLSQRLLQHLACQT